MKDKIDNFDIFQTVRFKLDVNQLEFFCLL